ncbi:YbgA family protein [Fictibacillus phosphorivorans]|uniref:YbgA family protein n=1 Tax=Fictibacillus phosphorivorans TaxID=1221500 RepID=UPI003CF37EC5
MEAFARPRVVVSKCLEFDACRYNGDVIYNDVIKKLMDYVDFVPVCPEVEIGLGTPRETIRIVKKGEDHFLLQPSTQRDVTTEMRTFSDGYLAGIIDTDGFILKTRSPSCGLKEVKVYASTEKGPAIGHSSGLFGGRVAELYSHLAIEEEGRLNNFTIRDRFYTKLFTLAAFRNILPQGLQAIKSFHQKNQFLFMAYSNPTLKVMNRILKKEQENGEKRTIQLYAKAMNKLFNRTARSDSNRKVANEIFKRFQPHLSPKEIAFFEELLQKYANKKEPFSSVATILKSHAIRFEDSEILGQTFFAPYPEILLEISDSGKGRDY